MADGKAPIKAQAEWPDAVMHLMCTFCCCSHRLLSNWERLAQSECHRKGAVSGTARVTMISVLRRVRASSPSLALGVQNRNTGDIGGSSSLCNRSVGWYNENYSAWSVESHCPQDVANASRWEWSTAWDSVSVSTL